MCGITGKVSGSVRVGEELLTRMCSVIEHRGPDSRGVFVEDGVGLAAVGLSLVMGAAIANQLAIGLPVLGFAVAFSLLVIAGDHQREFFVVAGRAAREEAAPRFSTTHCARDDLALVVERPPAPADELDLQTRAESTA